MRDDVAGVVFGFGKKAKDVFVLRDAARIFPCRLPPSVWDAGCLLPPCGPPGAVLTLLHQRRLILWLRRHSSFRELFFAVPKEEPYTMLAFYNSLKGRPLVLLGPAGDYFANLGREKLN